MKVFISYTHDSIDHDARVLGLSNALRERVGFDCDIDQYHSNQSWPTWMEERLEWADRVLVVCTETYHKRWNRNERPGIGLGAKWESFLIKQDLYEATGLNEKFIPVTFCTSDVEFIPKPLRDVSRIVVGLKFEGLAELENRILGIPAAQRPPISTSLLPISCAEGFFTQTKSETGGEKVSAYEFGLHDEPEDLFTNLFRVSYPERIYQMKTAERNSKKFLSRYWELRDSMGKSQSSTNFWCEGGRKGGMIYSLSTFDEPIWKELERRREIFPEGFISADNWAQSQSQADKSNFIKLLKRSLDHLCENNGTQYRITRSAKMDCHLFARKDEQLEGKISTMAIKSQAPRTVFKAIYSKTSIDSGVVQHWKHVAFRHRFVRFNRSWYMVLTPFWAFTSDGIHKPSPWQKKSSFNMQKPEKNRAVLGHIAFWASVLCGNEDMLDSTNTFSLKRPEILKIRPSIHDEDWVRVADEKDKAEFEEEEVRLL